MWGLLAPLTARPTLLTLDPRWAECPPTSHHRARSAASQSRCRCLASGPIAPTRAWTYGTVSFCQDVFQLLIISTQPSNSNECHYNFHAYYFWFIVKKKSYDNGQRFLCCHTQADVWSIAFIKNSLVTFFKLGYLVSQTTLDSTSTPTWRPKTWMTMLMMVAVTSRVSLTNSPVRYGSKLCSKNLYSQRQKSNHKYEFLKLIYQIVKATDMVVHGFKFLNYSSIDVAGCTRIDLTL